MFSLMNSEYHINATPPLFPYLLSTSATMHKWHVNAALGRGRPLSDIVNVTDSIALSLRQFHISALRAQDEQPSCKAAYNPFLSSTLQTQYTNHMPTTGKQHPNPLHSAPEENASKTPRRKSKTSTTALQPAPDTLLIAHLPTSPTDPSSSTPPHLPAQPPQSTPAP